VIYYKYVVCCVSWTECLSVSLDVANWKSVQETGQETEDKWVCISLLFILNLAINTMFLLFLYQLLLWSHPQSHAQPSSTNAHPPLALCSTLFYSTLRLACLAALTLMTRPLSSLNLTARSTLHSSWYPLPLHWSPGFLPGLIAMCRVHSWLSTVE
jgi:hypothetical protein